MKNTLTLILCLFIVSPLYARNKSKMATGYSSFYGTMIADYHLNGGDVKGAGSAEILQSPNAVGGRFGLDYFRVNKYRMQFYAGFHLRVAPQQLNIHYSAEKSGFTGSGFVYDKTIRFTDFSLVLNGGFGHSFKTPGDGAIDFAGGVIFGIPFNGQSDTGALIFDHISDPYYKDLLLYERSAWGSNNFNAGTSDGGIPLLVGARFQAGYSFLKPAVFKDRTFRLGLDVSIMAPTGYHNQAEVTYFGPGREHKGTAKFNDAHLALGLIMSVEL
jgi:hypothetical protein